MGLKLTGQLDESKKAPVARWAAARGTSASRAAPLSKGPRAGTEWQRKMRSLAVRLSKRGVRRDRSGAPMRQGA